MSILATETHDLIPAICQQFTEATGWPLQFQRGADPGPPQNDVQQDSECCWSATVEDGAAPVGRLRLNIPAVDAETRNFVPVSELAGMLAELISRLTAATRRLESQTRDVSVLADAGLSTRNNTNLPDALSQLLSAAVQLTGFRSAAFFLLNPTTNRLKVRALHQLELDELPQAGRDLASSPPDLSALVNGPVSIQRQSATDDRWLPAGNNCALCVAVQSATVPIGTLWVFDRRTHLLVDQQAHLLKSIAGQIATVLERVVWQRESETQFRLATELRLASQTHSGSFPVNLATTAGLEVAVRYASRHELGGDLCELIPLSNSSTGIALGDASGNSIPAALVMSAVRGGLRAHPGNGGAREAHPARIMERLNDALHDITGPHQFMSLFYGIYDAPTRRFTYTNAGHPAPFLFRRGEVRSLDSHGLLLGVLRELVYDSSVLELEAGDILVLFSDGISEAMDAKQKLFGNEGIVAAVKTGPHLSAEEVLQGVWTRAEAHARGSKELDDRALLVLRVR